MNSILTEQRGDLGLITLNRPQALNALNLEMVNAIADALDRWEHDERVRHVMFVGAGERAFCAGGDLKDFYTAKATDGDYSDISKPETFFAAEYELNVRIFHYPKDTIAFMDGIVMGGGFGIGGHCDVRITSDTTLFAMPETAIGFFPDIGAMYHLTRAPHSVGKYIALTANRFTAADMHYAGLATHHVGDAVVGEVIDAVECRELDDLSSNTAGGVLQVHAAEIEALFAADDVHDILAALKLVETSFARETLATLQSRAPMSVAVAAMQYRRSIGLSFDDVMRQEFILCQNFMRAPDIYEGIRAVLIDKDNPPRWSPVSFDEIKERDIARYFASPS